MKDSQPSPASPPNPYRADPPPRKGSIEGAVDGLITGIARHWLFLFNGLWGIYVLLPFLAPIFMQLGWTAPARMIYAGYSFLCHQLPDHSYFLFGQTLAPDLSQLQAAGMDANLNLLAQRSFIGNALAGYKVAICQRDIAIYGSVLVGGLLYAWATRKDGAREPLDWRLYILLLIPMALDGGTQLFGLRESNWWLRSATGALFGIASVWLIYPYVDGAMRELLNEMSAPRPSAPHNNL